jgi:uncharacterized protein with NAD-binding domain and iron-sulfur cluster/nitrite reductase/ring-hydroxylating ferredoxin subunit
MLRLIKSYSPANKDTLISEDEVTVKIAREFANPKLEILRLLHEACEIEHSLMVQYLYAAFSIAPKYADIAGTPDPSRSDCLLGVATQEMRHFRQVNQLLVKFGGQPNMIRQDFPYESEIYPFAMSLERLTLDSLAKYVYAEAPAGVFNEKDLASPADREFAKNVLDRLNKEARFNHIGTLYQTILDLIDKELLPEDRPADLDSIREIILEIRKEGEGGHFEFFKALFLGKTGSLNAVEGVWEDPDSSKYPSLPVPTDPTVFEGSANTIKDPVMRAIANLGNLHYWIILSLLQLSYEDETATELSRLAVGHMRNALYPLSDKMSALGGGMPFDALSLGYAQGVKNGDVDFLKELLAEVKTQTLAFKSLEIDAVMAERCLQQTENSIKALKDHPKDIFPPDTVVVIGAGPAGLAAACTLISQNIPVCLMERSRLIGGKVHSFHEEGRSIEHGIHGWWLNYLNFNALLEQAGVELDDALKKANGSNLVQLTDEGPKIHQMKIFRWNIPSPLNLVLQTLKAPYLRWWDTIFFTKFALHMLAFSHERDYLRYDKISFKQMMNDLGVPPRVQHLILTPFILSFDFDVPERISASCGLSGTQFYILPSQDAILTRWSRGLPADKVFNPLSSYFMNKGGRLLLNTPVERIEIEGGEVKGVDYASSFPIEAGEDVLASLPLDQLSEGAYVPVLEMSGKYWVNKKNGNYRAWSARCTHMGGDVNWTGPGEKFVCSFHGGRFDEDGNVIQGPPTIPLVAIKTRVAGDRLQLLGTLNEKTLPCRDVILATDTHAAQLLLENSPNIDPTLVKNVKKLDTTPVIVVRLWFDETLDIDRELESGLTPDAEFIDNFFFVNTFSKSYDHEGIILEVQSYRVEKWINSSDEEILEISFKDLTAFLPQATREKMKFSKIQRHLALFTKYAPGKAALRPSVSSGTYGLHLAGDWTEADWSVWMMERAVVSGLRAANVVLKRRGLPMVEIKRLPKEGLTLRSSRFFGRLIRSIFWRKYPG